jgi:hypothetical protein
LAKTSPEMKRQTTILTTTPSSLKSPSARRIRGRFVRRPRCQQSIDRCLVWLPESIFRFRRRISKSEKSTLSSSSRWNKILRIRANRTKIFELCYKTQ